MSTVEYIYSDYHLEYIKDGKREFKKVDSTGSLHNVYRFLLAMNELRDDLGKISELKPVVNYKEQLIELSINHPVDTDDMVSYFRTTYIFDSTDLDLVGYRNESELKGDKVKQYVYVAFSNLQLRENCEK